MIQKRIHWRLLVLRWHRRVGLVLSIILVWLLGSGVLLNHTDDLLLNKQFIRSKMVLAWYGIAPSAPLTIARKNLNVTHKGLFLAQENLGLCPKLLGIAPLEQMYLVACPERLVLLSDQAVLIEQIDAIRGLQPRFIAMAQHNGSIFLKDEQSVVYTLNLNNLTLSPTLTNTSSLTWLSPTLASTPISMERVLLDAHAGRLFGRVGQYLLDAFSLLLLLLLISGWWLAKKRHKN